MLDYLRQTPVDPEYQDDQYTNDNGIDHLFLKKAKCSRIVRNLDARQENSCMCGKLFDEHDMEIIDEYKKSDPLIAPKWTVDTCTSEDGKTDAYGTMRFIDAAGDTEAQYIRVHYQTPIDKIIRLLFTQWNLKEPNLLISVTGGAQRFSLKPKLKDVFRKGLVKAAASTGAWISTGGHYIGVMKHVGEAIREYASTINASEKIVVLGIANWTMVANNQSLIRKNRDFDAPKEYSLQINAKDRELKKQPLDPNHTHFILVDTAQTKYAGEIKLRGELESTIANRSSPVMVARESSSSDFINKDEKIPIVVLVLEGGVGTIQTVLESCRNGSPCVFIEGSGKCADMFAFALKSHTEREHLVAKNSHNIEKFDENFKNELKSRIKKEWGDKNVDSIYSNITEAVFTFSHLLSVFCLDSNDQAYDIDVAILSSLLKTQKDNFKAQLRLAITWNRVDIARDFIFKDDLTWKLDELDDIMYYGLMANRVEFVKLLIDNGFNLRSFLTPRVLLKLYTDSFRSDVVYKLTPLYSQLVRNKPTVLGYGFKDIGDVIEKLVNNIYQPHFSKEPYASFNSVMALTESTLHGKPLSDTKTRDDIDVMDRSTLNPENDLFMLNVLQVKPEMAKIFIFSGTNEIASALIASIIFKSYAAVVEGEELHFQQLARDFENIAIEILDNCYKKSEEKAYYLLIREITVYGNTTVLQLAIACEARRFVAHICAQELLSNIWYGKILADTSMLNMTISFVIPALAPLLLEYRAHKLIKLNSESASITKNKIEPRRSLHQIIYDKSHLYADSNEEKLSYFKKLYQFFKVPLVKWVYSQLFNVLFLLLFSYVMLSNFYPATSTDKKFSAYEIMLVIWFVETDSKSLKYRTKLYYSDAWNRFEVFAIFLYLIAFVLRLIPDCSSCYVASRILFSFDLILWFLRCLSFYAVFRNVGPKLVMIKSLIYEEMYFVSILVVFIFAFGISTQSMLYHNQEFDVKLLENVFYTAFFVIGGNYMNLETIMGADTCVQTNITQISNDIYNQNDCPEINGAKASLAIYVPYVLVAYLLLVNLLIAIFTYVYMELEEDADNIWKFQRYSVIYNYYHRPILPAPLNIITFNYYMLRYVLNLVMSKAYLKHLTQKKRADGINYYFSRAVRFLLKPKQIGFRVRLSKHDDHQLTRWESYIAEDYNHIESSNSKDKQNPKIQEALEKINLFNKRLDDMRNEINEKIDGIIELLRSRNGGNESKYRFSPPSTTSEYDETLPFAVLPSAVLQQDLTDNVFKSETNLRKINESKSEMGVYPTTTTTTNERDLNSAPPNNKKKQPKSKLRPGMTIPQSSSNPKTAWNNEVINENN